MSSDDRFVQVGRMMLVVWVVLGFANIGYDWFSFQRVSPISLSFLVAMVVLLAMWALGMPVITRRGMGGRVGFVAGLLVATAGLIGFSLLLR